MQRILFFVAFFLIILIKAHGKCCNGQEISSWNGNRKITPLDSSWSLSNRIPMGTDSAVEEARGKLKVKKKFQKYLLPLLLAYKLKFFTLIPVLIGGLILLAGATGLAGFFFALFAAVLGLKAGHEH